MIIYFCEDLYSLNPTTDFDNIGAAPSHMFDKKNMRHDCLSNYWQDERNPIADDFDTTWISENQFMESVVPMAF